MEPEGSLPRPQEPATCPYPEPAQSSPYPPSSFTCQEDVHSYRMNLTRGLKGKAIPLEAWTGPEGSRRLRLPDFKTVGI